MNFPVGSLVMSLYAARWTGVVVERFPAQMVVVVQVTHDQNGRPVRKPRSAHWLRRMSAHWLTPLGKDAVPRPLGIRPRPELT